TTDWVSIRVNPRKSVVNLLTLTWRWTRDICPVRRWLGIYQSVSCWAAGSIISGDSPTTVRKSERGGSIILDNAVFTTTGSLLTKVKSGTTDQENGGNNTAY